MTDEEAVALITYGCIESDHRDCDGQFCACPCHQLDAEQMAKYREITAGGDEAILRRFTPEAREFFEKWKR